MKIGVFGKSRRIPPKLCKKNLHELGGHPYCRECRYVRQMTHYWALMLEKHWGKVLT